MPLAYLGPLCKLGGGFSHKHLQSNSANTHTHTHTYTLLANKAILGIALGTPVLMHWLQVVANHESFFFHKHLQQTSGAGKQDHSWHCPPSLGTSVMHLLQVACTKSSCEPDAGGPYTRNIRASFRRPLAPNCSFAHQTCGQKVAVGHISPSGGCSTVVCTFVWAAIFLDFCVGW